jgi:YARHG domain
MLCCVGVFWLGLFQPRTAGGEAIFQGEKYPMTRTTLMSREDVANWSFAQVRYAINEIYARHGYDFPKQEIKSVFLRYRWYRDRLQPGRAIEELESEFNQYEAANLRLLGEVRDGLQSGRAEHRAEARGVPSTGSAGSDAGLRRKLRDLRDDHTGHNCTEACAFFGDRASDPSIQEALLREFQVTDAQGRECIFHILYEAANFHPDSQFIQAVLKRMQHYGSPDDRLAFPTGAGSDGADFLIKHVKEFGDLVAGAINSNFTGRDNSLWFQYAVARALAKGRIIDQYASRYDENFLSTLADNLKNDRISSNAELAAATFLFLGDIGVRKLQSVANGSDRQARKIAALILSYFSDQLTMDELCERLGQSEFIGFDCVEGQDNLEDCDPKKDVLRIMDKPPEQVFNRWKREAGHGDQE